MSAGKVNIMKNCNIRSAKWVTQEPRFNKKFKYKSIVALNNGFCQESWQELLYEVSHNNLSNSLKIIESAGYSAIWEQIIKDIQIGGGCHE